MSKTTNEFRLNPEDKKTKKSYKIKEMIPVETRISLYQTAMNNSGRNFEGKRVKVKKMADFGSALYKLAIKEIEGIGQLSLKQIEQTFKKAPVKKRTKKASVKKLMNKIKNGKKAKKKSKKRKAKR